VPAETTSFALAGLGNSSLAPGAYAPGFILTSLRDCLQDAPSRLR